MCIRDRAWNTLREQVNKQSEAINQLHIRLETLQAVQEARTAFVLEGKLDELQKKYDDMEAEKAVEDAVPPAAPAPSATSCPPGYVSGSDGKCRVVHASVAAKMKQNEKQAVSAQKELKEEKRRRLEAESGKQDLMFELLERGRDEQRPLKALPKSLEEASKL